MDINDKLFVLFPDTNVLGLKPQSTQRNTEGKNMDINDKLFVFIPDTHVLGLKPQRLQPRIKLNIRYDPARFMKF